MAQVTAFVSGKGGMGTTALCAAVAAAMALEGKRVLCIDCDDGAGDLGAYLGLGQLPDITYPQVCRGEYPLERASAQPSLSRLRFLAAPAGRESVDAAQFAALIAQAERSFDYIFLDEPQFLSHANQVLLVTAANPAAIRGARRLADTLELQGIQNTRLLVNFIDKKEMSAMGLTVDDVMDQVGAPLAGIVPRDNSVTLACAEEKLLHTVTKKGAAAAAQRIARRMQGMHIAIPTRVL